MSEIGQAARRLLVGGPGDVNAARQLAERAATACERLAHHLARVLGDTGVRMLLHRSVVTASARFPWLQPGPAAGELDAPWSVFRGVVEQEPGSISDAFVDVFSTFVGLLKRLIGDALVEQLLNEVWPAVFVPSVKDTP